MFGFGKPKLTPTEQVRRWKRDINREVRELDRSIRNITLEERKTKMEIQKLVKRGDRNSIVPLAKELVLTRKAKTQIMTNKAHLNSVSMQLQANLATVKVAGVLEKSTAVMHAMSEMMSVSMVSETLRELSKEMAKAGYIDEMVEDTLEMVHDDIDEEEEEDAIKAILAELIPKTKAESTPAPVVALPEVPTQAVETTAAATEKSTQEQIDSMKKRLEAL